MNSAALRDAFAFPLDPAWVEGCLKEDQPADDLFNTAWRDGLSSLGRAQRRGQLCHVIGEVAEAVAEVLLVERGYSPVYDVCQPGIHGVDLLLLTPDAESVVAIEAKGTLRSGYLPRLSGRRLTQMSIGWLDKPGNPGMVEWGLEGVDVYGALAVVNLADMVCRVGFTSDFETLLPVIEEDQLDSLEWLRK